jgi:hypothetical protein
MTRRRRRRRRRRRGSGSCRAVAGRWKSSKVRASSAFLPLLRFPLWRASRRKAPAQMRGLLSSYASPPPTAPGPKFPQPLATVFLKWRDDLPEAVPSPLSVPRRSYRHGLPLAPARPGFSASRDFGRRRGATRSPPRQLQRPPQIIIVGRTRVARPRLRSSLFGTTRARAEASVPSALPLAASPHPSRPVPPTPNCLTLSPSRCGRAVCPGLPLLPRPRPRRRSTSGPLRRDHRRASGVFFSFSPVFGLRFARSRAVPEANGPRSPEAYRGPAITICPGIGRRDFARKSRPGKRGRREVADVRLPAARCRRPPHPPVQTPIRIPRHE